MALTYPLSQVIPEEFVDAPDWNALVDSINFLANPPACRVRVESGLPTTNGAWYAIVFGTAQSAVEEYDTAALHDLSTNPSRLTAPVAGLYHCFGGAQFDPVNATGIREWRIRRNGSDANADQVARVGVDVDSTSVNHRASLSGDIKLAAGDYVEFLVVQSSGVSADTRVNVFGMRWVGLGT